MLDLIVDLFFRALASVAVGGLMAAIFGWAAMKEMGL